MTKKTLLPAALIILLAACDRAKLDAPSLTFKAPDQASLGLPDIGADKKFCFGVNVVAEDLVTREASACAPKWGQASALVDSGQDISVAATSGKNREIELYAYLTNANSNCPSADEAWAAKGAALGRLYKVGSATGVEITGSEMTVSIPITTVKLNQSVMAAKKLSACERPQPGVVSQLTAGGEVLSPANETRGDSLLTALWESISQWNPFSDGDSAGGTTSGGETIDATTVASFPPYLRSVTRKPDSLDYFALVDANRIVRVSTTGLIVDLDAGTCPFDFDGCRVPEWAQSISPGYGGQLFVMDHAGQVYRQAADQSLQPVGAPVAPIVSHVVFY